MYGSGYPDVYVIDYTYDPGVANRGFPFVFWPVVWGAGLGYGAAYLHDTEVRLRYIYNPLHLSALFTIV